MPLSALSCQQFDCLHAHQSQELHVRVCVRMRTTMCLYNPAYKLMRMFYLPVTWLASLHGINCLGIRSQQELQEVPCLHRACCAAHLH